jgi:hypothetical protein
VGVVRAFGAHCQLPISNCRLKDKELCFLVFQSAIGNWQSAIRPLAKIERHTAEASPTGFRLVASPTDQ